MKTLCIAENDAGQRLDKFLLKTFHALPPSMMYKFIRTKKIKVNRSRTDQKYILRVGDTVQLFVPPEFLVDVPQDTAYLHIIPRLQIVYEDANILIVNKPQGVPVHADDSGARETLIDQIKAYLLQTGAYQPQRELSFTPALCNRIDRNTCGMVLSAKTAAGLRALNEAIRCSMVQKAYLCVVHGDFAKEPKTARLHGYLVKDAAQNRVSIYDRIPSHIPRDRIKTVQTGYEVLCTHDNLSLLRVQLYTGRTHQIRAHLAHIGHPLCGDGKYGANAAADRVRGYVHQALCAYQLRFATFSSQSVLFALSQKTLTLPPQEIWFVREFLRDAHKEESLHSICLGTGYAPL